MKRHRMLVSTKGKPLRGMLVDGGYIRFIDRTGSQNGTLTAITADRKFELTDGTQPLAILFPVGTAIRGREFRFRGFIQFFRIERDHARPSHRDDLDLIVTFRSLKK